MNLVSLLTIMILLWQQLAGPNYSIPYAVVATYGLPIKHSRPIQQPPSFYGSNSKGPPLYSDPSLGLPGCLLPAYSVAPTSPVRTTSPSYARSCSTSCRKASGWCSPYELS